MPHTWHSALNIVLSQGFQLRARPGCFLTLEVRVVFSTSERPRRADAKQACAELRMARGVSWETGTPVRVLALEAQP